MAAFRGRSLLVRRGLFSGDVCDALILLPPVVLAIGKGFCASPSDS